MNNKDLEKPRFTANLTFISRFMENNLAKSRLTATMEITIHEERIGHFTFHGKKRADHKSRKSLN